MLSYHLLTASLICSLATAQKVKPDPIFDCSNPNFQVIYTACDASDYTKCCAVGTDCCAGGCCDLLSFCVGRGTSKETCCDVNDPNRCGTGDGTLPPQNVICTGSDGLSSYTCPPGSTCDTRNDKCFLPESSQSSSPETTAPQTEQSTEKQTLVTSTRVTSDTVATTTDSGDENQTVTVAASGDSTTKNDEPVTVTVGGDATTSDQPVTVTAGGDTTTSDRRVTVTAGGDSTTTDSNQPVTVTVGIDSPTTTSDGTTMFVSTVTAEATTSATTTSGAVSNAVSFVFMALPFIAVSVLGF